MEQSRFYITTPIYYVNDKPHIGHAYTTILADVLARYHRIAGDKVFFLTGLDEHGQKVQQAAQSRGLSPQDHCDDLAPRFLDLWKKLGIQNDDFIRTTQKRHVETVQKILRQVHAAGDIYIDEYEGWYSVAEERFITEIEKNSGEFRDVKMIKEKNYFFKMGKYQKQLIQYIEENPEFIQPPHRRNEVLGFLKNPLGDLCISRPKSRMDWGIELPFDKDYVTYVWFDALINYITAPGFEKNKGMFADWWPASIHLIGKDILTTHAVYWSTMLFSIGISLPKTIFAHGWWLIGETKMSKTLGNIVNPLDLIDQYGVDAIRYYLMREMVLGQDANFTVESFIQRYNGDLANDFGNLLNRISGLLGKNFDGCTPPSNEKLIHTTLEKAKTLSGNINILIGQLKVHEAIEEVMALIRLANNNLEKEAPWKMIKEGNKEAAGYSLYVYSETVRLGAVALSPIMPKKMDLVLDILGCQGAARHSLKWGALVPGTKLKPHEALFPRIEIEP